MSMNPNQNMMAFSSEQLAERNFITEVYTWMGVALLLSGIVAYATASSPAAIHFIYETPFVLIGLFILELILVGALAGWVQRMSLPVAAATFLAYSILTGLTLSFVFLLYTSSSISTTFFVTAGTFGVMSVYGYATKTDLTSIGNLCFMLLIGVIIASIVNFFFSSPALYWIVTYVGIFVFVGLTAYDTQKIKRMSAYARTGREQEQKMAIHGALSLYLDFINLFLLLLRLFGSRRD